MYLLLAAAHAATCAEVAEVTSLRVDIDFVRSTASHRWTLRYDPAGCEKPEALPEALPGVRWAAEATAADGGMERVLERVELLSGAGSDSIDPWRAPAERTTVQFRAPPTVPLQVYTDEAAHQYADRDGVVVWWPLGSTGRARMVWTTWPDWVSAGTALERAVLAELPRPGELGVLGRSLSGAQLSALVGRVDRAVELAPSSTTGWAIDRPLGEALATGRGSAAERALILLAMLRGAGFDARPAWFTPDDDPELPRTLPAPHVLPFPAIGVNVDGETLYLDPGTSGALPPEVPARVRGGRVLVAGRHLTVPVDTGAPRGEVRVDAEVTTEATGKVGIVAKVRPTGAAEQALRARLSGLGAERWQSVVGGWITPRGSLRDLVVDVQGLDGMEPLAIVVRFTEPTKLAGSGAALRGTVRDLLAPGLAKILPPGIAIEERLRVIVPDGMLALTAIRPPAVDSPDVLLNRTLSTEGPHLTLNADWRVLGARIPEATLDAMPKDLELLVFPADPTARKAAKRLELDPLDLGVLDAMLRWRLDQPDKAVKALGRLHRTHSVQQLADRIGHYVPPGDRRPWEALVRLVATDDERLAVIEALVGTGDRRLAWQLATFMASQSPDPITRARAMVQVARFQGPEQPDGRSDPDGHRAWREPIKLLEKASSLAAADPGLTRLDLARAYLRHGRPMDAGELLDAAIEVDATPLAKALRAEFGARTGVYGVDVLGLVREATAAAPFDPEVRDASGRALAHLGRRRQGVSDILLAAELAGNDATRWMTAAELAAEFGDLRAAGFAARRASDLEPASLVHAVKLQLLAKLARDERTLELAVRRSEGVALYDATADTLDALVELAPERELALLRHHTAEVEADRDLLRRRAELHFERNMTEDAAQDGSLLLDRHKDAVGARYLLAGVTSRFRHADPLGLIKRHTRVAEVREARMDLQLALGEMPSAEGARGKIVTTARYRPESVAAEAETWPLAMRDFVAVAPAGFRDNRFLSGVTGVMAWSDAQRQMTVLRTERSTGALPPPLANLYRSGPTVLSTSRGAAVIRLDGGAIPLFAGITLVDGQDVFGLGLSPAAARDAVLYGIGAIEPPR